MLISLLCLAGGALGQDAVEAAYVRGHFSSGDGIWRASDFGWFYYDVDEDQGGEELTVHLTGRTAEEGDIIYSSKTWTSPFEYEPWGTFQEVAFLGSPYLAGYPESNLTEEISSLGKGELRRVLRNEEITYTLGGNKTLSLQQGYSLAAVDVSEKKGTVKFALLKNRDIIYASLVSIGDTFVYKIDDVPVILVHLSDAMKSSKEGFAEVDGIFQVSDAPDIKLFDGALIGNMKLNSYSEDGLVFQNNISLSLIRDSEVPLTGNLRLVVLDMPDLTYYPVGIIFDYGVHEIRGPVFGSTPSIPVRMGEYSSSAIARWNSQNYSGFFFDPDNLLSIYQDSMGGETLVFYSVNGRRLEPPYNYIRYEENKTIKQPGIQYTCIIQPKEFEYKPWGYYYTLSFVGDTWFAGYDSSLEGRNSSFSLLEQDYLGRVLIDSELEGIIVAGNYSLQEGYEMHIRDVGNDSLFLQLFKDGRMVDSSVVFSNTTYMYKKDMENINDMPIIMMHFGNVFNNGTERLASLDGIFQISESTFSIDPGTGFGELEIVNVFPEGMIMLNPDPINLNRNSDVGIGPGMSVHVADNDTLRYYLYQLKYVVPSPEPPLVKVQDNVSSLSSANFSLIVRAAEIRQVLVNILDSSNRTVFTRDITSIGQGSGEWWVYAWKWNATTLQLSDDGSLVIDAGGPVPALLYLNSSAPAEQVSVIFDSEGRIAAILKTGSIFYISRNEFSRMNNSLDYDAMLANSTAKNQFIKIEPGESILQLFDVIDGRLVPSHVNHTLHGTLDSLEPHAVTVGTPPGRYELRTRIENAVNAIQSFGYFFNVTAAPIRGVSLGSASAPAGEEATVPLLAGNSSLERRIDISYNTTLLEAVRISGGNASWQVDGTAGRISILLPAGCEGANLTFSVRPASANQTALLEVTDKSGLTPEVRNGSISILGGDQPAKKSDVAGVLASLFALAAAAYTLQRR